MWHALVADRLAGLGLLVLLVLAVGRLTSGPGLPERLGAVFFSILTLVAIRRGFDRIRSAQERGFWNDLTVATAAWLALAILLVVDPSPSAGVRLLGDGFLALHYVGLNLALERGPDRRQRWRPVSLERALTWPAMLLVVGGLFLYFAVLPAFYDQAYLVAGLTVPLDLYFSLRLLQLWNATSSSRWRAIYGFVALSTVASLTCHATALFSSPGDPGWEVQGLHTLPWGLSAFFLVLAASVRHYVFKVSPTPHSPGLRRAGVPGPLGQSIFFTLLFPLIHYAGTSTASRTGVDPLNGARETLVFLLLTLLGILAMLQYRMLASTAAQLARERARVEKGLMDVEQNLKLRRESEKAFAIMRASGERFAQIFHACPDVMALVRETDDRILDINASALDVFGIDPTDMIGQTTEEIGLWARPRDRRLLIRASHEDDVVYDFEGSFLRRDGEVRQGLFSVARVHLEGEPHRFVIIRDVTATREAERRLASRFRSLDRSSCAIGAADAASGRITFWNAAAERLLGIPAPEALGRQIREIATWDDGEVTWHGAVPQGLLSLAIPILDASGARTATLLLASETGIDPSQADSRWQGATRNLTNNAKP